MIWFNEKLINYLGPGETIWWHRFRSTLALVMVWCLTAPSHCLDQCWLIINEDCWHLAEGNFTETVLDISQYKVFKNCIYGWVSAKKNVTPLLKHKGYIFPALTYRYVNSARTPGCQYVKHDLTKQRKNKTICLFHGMYCIFKHHTV